MAALDCMWAQSGDHRRRKKLIRHRYFSCDSSAALLQHHSYTIEPAKFGTVCDNVFIPIMPDSLAWNSGLTTFHRSGGLGWGLFRQTLWIRSVVCNVLHVEGNPPLLIFGIICGCCWSDSVQITGSHPAWDKAKNSADGITVQLCWAGAHLAHQLAGKNAECVL